ncbi:serine/threonine-protein kinase [Streptomyces griseosporeus]|uniref:serine/threonine-protein kinase n=1 Tax=Streptomyces griseosporeus TaxID=1910 RepID=UPI0036FD1A73
MHQPGEIIDGRYRLKDLLGRGGMGEVWSAEDIKLGRPVAIKLLIMPHDAGHAGWAVKRLGKEARALAAVGHPHAVTVYDWGGEGGVFYITMELLRGQTLQMLLDQARLDLADGAPLDAALPALSDVVRWTDEICEVLESAHAGGIVHRDIKPSNVMVTRHGAVRVLDFGIAKMLEESGQTTGMILGTPDYMSPEQFRGAAGRQSDLYSLGCLMYALVTGWPPVRGEGVIAPGPGDLRPGLPTGLDSLIVRLLEVEPAKRPQGAAEVRRLLEDVLGRPSAEPTPELWTDPEFGPEAPDEPEAGLPEGAEDSGQEAALDQEADWYDTLYASPPEAPVRRQPRPLPSHQRERKRDVRVRESAELAGSVLLTWGGTWGLVQGTTELSFGLAALCAAAAAALAFGAQFLTQRFQLYPYHLSAYPRRSGPEHDIEGPVTLASCLTFLGVLAGCWWLMASQTDMPWWADALAGTGEALGIALGTAGLFTFLADDGSRNVGPILFNGFLLGTIAFGLFFAALGMAWWTSMIAALGVWAAVSFLSMILEWIAEEAALATAKA